MAKVDMLYNCGCGVKYRNEPEQARSHVDTTGHRMTVQGSISPPADFVKPRKDKAAAYSAPKKPTRARSTVQPVEPEPPAPDPGFNALRNKLGRK